MRLGTLCHLYDLETMHQRIAQGFEFLELQASHDFQQCPSHDQFPAVPLIWQCPPDLPAEHPADSIRRGVLESWREHLAAAQKIRVVLMVVQFRRPGVLSTKTHLIQNYVDMLSPLTSEAREGGVQLVLRNSPNNRDQLQLLREVVRQTAGLGLALDVAYTQHQVIKNLANEYLWDSDLSPRLTHVYVSDTNGNDAQLRLPLGCLGNAGVDWSRLVPLLKGRYNASITIDTGQAAPEYAALSREKFQHWWAKA
jgi:sugar phosphate isomerase/epimerase